MTNTKKISTKEKKDLDDKVVALFKSERKRAKEKFPLVYALIATFGAVCVLAGLNKFVEKIDLFKNNPIILIIFGLLLLLVTGATYKKLG